MTALSALALTALLALPSCAEPAAPPRAQGGAPPRAAAEEFDQTHALWTAVLKAHVHDDRFDYAKLKAEPAQLDQYLKALSGVQAHELAAWTREQRFAFWINAYNAFTVKKVVANYPLKSIKDLDSALGLKSVFDDDFIALPHLHPEGKDAGPSPKEQRLSLNDVENGILRPTFKDARVHAAINCASLSCPALSAEAFVAEKLERQLDERMRAFLADARRNRFDAEKGRAEVSEVFKWFKEDFERDAGGVREFLLRFAPKEAQELLKTAKLEHLDYDWSLNDVERG
jgi:hypothetical protein